MADTEEINQNIQGNYKYKFSELNQKLREKVEKNVFHCPLFDDEEDITFTEEENEIIKNIDFSK